MKANLNDPDCTGHPTHFIPALELYIGCLVFELSKFKNTFDTFLEGANKIHTDKARVVVGATSQKI